MMISWNLQIPLSRRYLVYVGSPCNSCTIPHLEECATEATCQQQFLLLSLNILHLASSQQHPLASLAEVIFGKWEITNLQRPPVLGLRGVTGGSLPPPEALQYQRSSWITVPSLLRLLQKDSECGYPSIQLSGTNLVMTQGGCPQPEAYFVCWHLSAGSYAQCHW